MVYVRHFTQEGFPEETSTVDTSHHRYFYVSEKTPNEFWASVLEKNIFTESKTIYHPVIQSWLLDQLVIDSTNSLALIKHLIPLDDELYAYMFTFLHSSPKWWENVVNLYQTNHLDIPVWLKMACLLQVTPDTTPDKAHLITELETGPDHPEYPRTIPSAAVKTAISGSGEIPSLEVLHMLNWALHIDGWDDSDPPIEFFVVGNRPLILPRYIPEPDSMGYGLRIVPTVENGKIADIFIVDGGSRYRPGDIIEVMQEQGRNAQLQVLETIGGSVLRVQINNSGQGYVAKEPTFAFSSGYTYSNPYKTILHPSLQSYLPIPQLSIL